MKNAIALLVIVAVALPAVAVDPGNRAPAKPAGAISPSPPDPEVLRQGGDTFAEAVPLAIPAVDVEGTIVGYTDDYEVNCPYGYSPSPDVIYSIRPEVDMVVDVDLCGSSYDTALEVLDENLDRHACNDDFYSPGHPCGDWVSKIENMPIAAGALYYVHVDGYGGDEGDYLLNITEVVPCEVECPPAAVLEDEPPLAIDYLDQHNGGCNTDPDNPPFQPITGQVFCGVSGFYVDQGSEFRDTDWFLVEIPASGVLEITGDAELESYMFELGPQDCGSVAVIQNVVIGSCTENSMTITGEPGSTVWFWVGPTNFGSPDGSDVHEYDYTLWLNLDPVAVEDHSWTGVKALFD